MNSLPKYAKKLTVSARLLKILIDNRHVPLSTIDLLQQGILSPAAGIAILKKRGVIFDTTYQQVVDEDGTTHKGVAFYRIVGGVAP